MPGPFDDTLKHLTELSPRDWLVQGGWPSADTTVIDADIATISGATDKVIRVAGAPDWLLAVDYQAGHDTRAKLADLLLYNSALFKRHDLLVENLLVLLHPGADSPRVNGFYERGFPEKPFNVALRYRTVRVWQVPAEKWLTGGLGLVPLAPLGDLQAAQLPDVIGQMKDRFAREAPARLATDLWSATFILMGLRYEEALIQSLLQGVLAMQESVTYQAILREGTTKGLAQGRAEGRAEGEAEGEAKGKAEEARKMVLLQARSLFGDPPPEAVAALESLTDVSRLEELGLRLLQARGWEELLAGIERGSRRES